MKDLDFSAERFQKQHQFSVLGGEIHFSDCKTWSPSLLERVKEYYLGYGFEKETDIEIHYQAASGEFSSPNHRIWNDHLPETWFEADGVDQICISRDFAWKQKGASSVFEVIGPDLEFFPTDTLDNLMNSLFSKASGNHLQFILHASAVLKDGKAFIFFAPSGEGKSTLARLSYEQRGLSVIGADQVFLRFKNNQLWAYPSPSLIPEFPKSHPALCRVPNLVHGLFRLQKLNRYHFESSEVRRILPDFLSEMMPFLGPGWTSQQALDAAIRTLQMHQGPKGFVSYPQNEDFWRLFESPVKGSGNEKEKTL